MTPQPEPLVGTAGDQVQSAESDADRRALSDRREEPTGPWAALPPAGQRMKMRRALERRQEYYTDRFSSAMLVCVMLLVVASLADAALTIHVVHGGGTEINPLMSYLLNHGVTAFVVGKYALTVIGLPVFLIFRNHYLFGTRVRVGYLIPASVVMYMILLGYQIALIHYRVGW
jgi:hypothetical protein